MFGVNENIIFVYNSTANLKLQIIAKFNYFKLLQLLITLLSHYGSYTY